MNIFYLKCEIPFLKKLDEKFLIAIVLGMVPIGVDGVGQLFNFWESTNVIRVITGLMIGIVCGIAIGLIIDEFSEFRSTKSLSRNYDTEKK